tara:strand:- start:1858 stop:2217 length:360 start_codon:yes stop_codon:yes gene_type:complete
MKRLIFVFTQASFANLDGREGQDMALLCASFEQEVQLVFMQDGVYQLLRGQQPEKVGCKDYLARLKALSLYDIEQVYVCAQALKARQLKQEDLFVTPTQLIESTALHQLFKQADHVMVF